MTSNYSKKHEELKNKMWINKYFSMKIRADVYGLHARLSWPYDYEGLDR